MNCLLSFAPLGHKLENMPSAIVIKQVPGKPGQVYYPLEKIIVPESTPKENEVMALRLYICPSHQLTLSYLRPS